MDFIYIYLLYGFALPSTIIGILFAMAFMLSRTFSKNGYSLPVRILPLFLWLILFLYSLTFLLSGFRYPLSALFQHDKTRFITIGIVENVTDVATLPLYYDNTSHEWSKGKFIMVNGYQYYLPFCDVEVGTKVKLEWGCDERVVYKFSPITTISEDELVIQSPSNNKATKANSYSIIGRFISVISFTTFVTATLILYIKKNHVLDYLLKKDKEVMGKIIPSRIGLVLYSVYSLCFLGICAGCSISGFKGPLMIFLCIICLTMISAVKTINTDLIINENSVVLKAGKTTRTYCKEDILDVRFVSTRLPYNRCLMITFANGQKIGFDQLNFWGLGSTYLILSNNTDGSLS